MASAARAAWIPAFAGMTVFLLVIPAKAGIHFRAPKPPRGVARGEGAHGRNRGVRAGRHRDTDRLKRTASRAVPLPCPTLPTPNSTPSPNPSARACATTTTCW
ncbi:hypothetical protein GCM10028862_03530 [Luteimonas pelagia]